MEVVTATEEVDMVEAEEDMEEAAVVMEVEVAVVTIEKPATISGTVLSCPFMIYYVSRFNTCKHVTKLLLHFYSKKEQIIKRYKKSLLYNYFTLSFTPLLFIQMKLCSTTNQVFIFILNSIDNKENYVLSTFKRLHLNQYKIQTY